MRKSYVMIIFFGLFLVLTSTVGMVSAANWTVNPGDNIQSAVNNASSGDTIIVNDNNGSNYTYTENVVINKKLQLQAKNGGNTTLQALNPSNPVITLNSGADGSVIQGFIIKGASNSNGIYLSGTSNCKINGNNFYNNTRGIYINGGYNNTIQNNNLTGCNYGITLIYGSNNTIQNNNITNNEFGICCICSPTTISQNQITKNKEYGILLFNPHNKIFSVNLNFNVITGNMKLGLCFSGNYLINVNATNNWWGSNNPKISPDDESDINQVDERIIYCDPWLILNVTANPTSTNNTSTITADLTHNNNDQDTSSQGHVPDGIPIMFDNTLDNLTNMAYTKNGKVNNTFSRGSAVSGTALIKAILDKQTASTNITIDTTPPTITANLNSGVYNTTKTVTLTAKDNLDPHPTIYYTLNNTNPTTSSTRYTKPITISTTTTLKFIAVDNTGNNCGVQTRTYTIKIIDTTAPTVTANLNSGVYNTTQTITLTASDNLDPNPVIYYTTDGSNPTTSSTKYTKPIHIVENTILKFIAVDNTGNVAGVQTRNYTINVAHLIIHGPVCWDYLGGVDPYDAFSDPDIFDSMDENSFTELVVMARVAGYVSSYDTSRPTLENNIRQYMYEFALPKLQKGLELFWVYPSLCIDYAIPLNEPVKAVSVVIKQNNATTYDLQERVEIWVNGQLKFTQKFFNKYSPAYNPYYHINPYNLPIPILGVKDNITISLTYPGGSITKEEGISYMNDIDTWADLDHPETGFENIQSFAIAKTKITDNIMQSWLNQKSQYPTGYKKAMYGTFMTALTTLWLSDKLADEIASPLNVTWNRNTTTAVMVGVNSNGTAYVHTPDAGMGMNVNSSVDNRKSFRFVCSLLLSEVEHAAIGSTGLLVDSTVSKIISGILNGETFDMIRNGSTVTIMLDKDPNSKIVIDISTGLVQDLTIYNGFQFKGAQSQGSAYCYHDQLTDAILDQIPNWLQNLSGAGSGLLSLLGSGFGGIIGLSNSGPNNLWEIILSGVGPLGGVIMISVPAMYVEGQAIVYIRNKLVPQEYWQNIAYHPSDCKVIARIDPNDHTIHYIEVPMGSNGYQRWNEAVYI